MELFMRGELSRSRKSFQIELRLANQISRINFVQLKISHFDFVQNLKVLNIFFSQKLFDMI